jgi:hypothetical protein
MHKPARRKSINTLKMLNFSDVPKLREAAAKLPRTLNTICAEQRMPIEPLHEVRQLLSRRTRPTIRMTINDLLVLYRTVFNPRYKTSAALVESLAAVRQKNLVQAVHTMWKNATTVNPSMLLPIDAIRTNPRDRLFPSTFRSPFPQFPLEHEQTLRLAREARAARLGRENLLKKAHNARSAYLGILYAFTQFMMRYREIASKGDTMSITAIRLIAGLPEAMQRVADGIPGRFSFVNEAIKGEEVFSNVGQVVTDSSLTRFASAKDDNDKKVLVWGVMTSASGQLTITLRDFRPPVLALAQAGYTDLAHQITQDLLNAYCDGLRLFTDEMTEILKGDKP